MAAQVAAATETPIDAKRFNVGEVVTPPKPTQETCVAKLVQLLRQKEGLVAQVQQKVNAGQGLTVKGFDISAGQLREALAQVARPHAPAVGAATKAPTSASAPAAVAATAPDTGAASRWAVAAPSAAALAQKALQECETAEPFVRKVKNVDEKDVSILTKPNIFSHPTGENIRPGEIFDVIARCVRVQDGRTYLRLRKSEGWVSIRSHRNMWKSVLTSAEDGSSVEPVGSPTTFQSRASRVLSRVNADGVPLDAEGRAATTDAPLKESKTFKVSGGRGQSILSQPSVSASAAASGTLQAYDEFQADAVCIVAAEGRVYLRLQDGRGWVCERARGDFSRYAVEPVGFSVGNDEHERRAVARKLAGFAGGHKITMAPSRPKTSVIERTGIDLELEAIKVAAAHAAKPTPRGTPLKDEAVVLRSDSELWPKLCGAPRPINGEMRTILRRLSRQYFRRVKECEEDLKEVQARLESYTKACDGKKSMQSAADALQKEITKIEQEWKAAIEKDIAGVSSLPVKKNDKESGSGTVAPVVVLGESWHCAVVRAQQDDGDGGQCTVQHFGPLRADATAAAEDLQSLSEAITKWVASGSPVKEAEPSAKKRRVAKDAKDPDPVPSPAKDAD